MPHAGSCRMPHTELPDATRREMLALPSTTWSLRLRMAPSILFLEAAS